LIFTAKRINAREAERLGIPNQVVSENEAGNTARDLAKMIVANAPIAVQQAKRAIDNGAWKPPGESWTIEEEAYNITLETRDRNEALAAFAEKRAPKFQGR
jgi:enoyl-CoA hydratase/carnithine racemase